jgi:hypothetical protein
MHAGRRCARAGLTLEPGVFFHGDAGVTSDAIADDEDLVAGDELGDGDVRAAGTDETTRLGVLK